MRNTNRPNMYPGTCVTCGAHVAAGAGFLGPKVGGRWTTRCGIHAAGAQAARQTTRWDDDDDGYDRMKDAACEAGTWQHRPSRRRGW